MNCANVKSGEIRIICRNYYSFHMRKSGNNNGLSEFLIIISIPSNQSITIKGKSNTVLRMFGKSFDVSWCVYPE